MMPILTDTHSHIYDDAFDGDRTEAIARASQAGVGRIFLPAIDSDSYDRLFRLCSEYPDSCFPMMGLHPTSINDNPNFEAQLQVVQRYIEQPPEGIAKFYGVGEIGLDLHWSKDFLTQQTEAFRFQIELALSYHLPIAVHTRSAWPEMLEVLSEYKGRGLRGVMHAFSGTWDDFLAVDSIGEFWFGIGGPVTYKKSPLAETVEKMPLGRIVLETDCPYLPPVPFRGKRNESGYLPYIAEFIARLKNSTPDEIAEITTQNSKDLFGI